MKIKLINDLEIGGVKHLADTVLEIESEAGADLIAKGAASDYSVEENEAKIKSIVDSAVEKAVEKVEKAQPHSRIEVKDLSDEDPTHGYLETKSSYTESELHYGLGKFCLDVANERSGVSELLAKSRERAEKAVQKAAGDGQAVGRDADGGFTIPPAFNSMMLDASLEAAVVRPRATVIPIGTNVIDLPAVDDYDHSDNTVYGGVQAYWKSEESKLTSSKAKFRNIELKLKKLTALGYATTEMLRWSPVSIGGWLLPKFAEAVAWKEDCAFIAGSGVGEPLGIKNGGDYLEVGAEAGQAADTIVFANIAKMYAQNKGTDASMFFFAHKTTFPQLSQMTVGDSPVWLPANSAAGRPGQTLMGLPLVYTEKTGVVGDAGDIVLATGSQYLIADDQQGPELAQSMHLKFDYDQTAFKVVKFVDGQPAHRTTFTDKQGSVFANNTGIAAR